MAQFHFCRCKAEWFVRDGLGMTCSGLTYCLILFAEFVVIGVILLPGFPLSAWSYVHAILFSFLAFLAAFSHLRAMTTNPVIILYFNISLVLFCTIKVKKNLVPGLRIHLQLENRKRSKLWKQKVSQSLGKQVAFFWAISSNISQYTVNDSNLGQPDKTCDSNSTTISPNLQSHLIITITANHR